LKLSAPGEAYRSLIRAVELQPNNADALIKTADIEIMAASQSTGQQQEQFLDEAEGRGKKIVGLKDGTYDGNRILGQIALVRGKAGESIEFLEKADKIKSNEPSLRQLYFVALVQANRFPDAEKVARDLIGSKKDYAPIYDLLYVEYARRRDFEAAEKVLIEKSANNRANSSYVLQLAGHYGATANRPALEQTMARLNDEKVFPDGHLAAGDFYFLRARDFGRAQEQYEAGARAFPKERATYQKRLVELYASSNRNDEAKKVLEQVLSANATDSEALAMRAALRLTTSSRDEVNLAVTELQALVSKTPSNHLLHFNLGRGLLARGDMEQGRLQLEETLKLRPDFLAARELLAKVYLTRAEGAKALQEAEAILRQEPNNLGGHLARSSALLLLQENDKARQELDYITTNFPENSEGRYQSGFLAYTTKDYAKASQMFTQLHKENPKDFRGLVGVVETLAEQNKMGEAVQEVEASVAAEPDRKDLKTALANLYVRSQRYDQAIKIYQELLQKDPKAADILFKLAETYRRRGDLNQALEAFRKASQAAPSDPAPLLQLGLLMDGTGRREQAKPIYEQILRIQQDHPIALNNLAYIKAEEGTDLDTALSMAQRALQAQPQSPDIADTLGWVYIRKNLSGEAVRVFTDLVKKFPTNPMYHYHYGMALMQRGDRPAAKRELEAALKNQPSKSDADKIQQLLRQL
jgi:tetratricopeptide (TPR) repeat protein